MNNTERNEIRTKEHEEKFSKKKLLENLINNDKPLIFDIGANIGDSINFFKSIWPNSIIHAFEPQKSCFEQLDDTASKYTGSVIVNKVGVGDLNSKNVDFYTHELSKGLAGVHKINLESNDSIDFTQLRKAKSQTDLNDYLSKINNLEKIEIIKIEDYILNNPLNGNYIDLLKIDTEGYEPEVLVGIGEELKNVKFILTEILFYDYYEKKLSFYDIERVIKKYGFELYEIFHISKNPMNGRTDWVDVIYKNSTIR
jgi:FkbM family methyltransferase